MRFWDLVHGFRFVRFWDLVQGFRVEKSGFVMSFEIRVCVEQNVSTIIPLYSLSATMLRPQTLLNKAYSNSSGLISDLLASFNSSPDCDGLSGSYRACFV